jgi:hypothetical protein
MQAIAGSGWPFGGPFTYIEDVFSTWLYTGTNATQTITNGIDLSGKGGLVWIKSRTSVDSGTVFDTARGATNYLFTPTQAAQATLANTLTAFNSNGFSLGTDTNIGTVNTSTTNYVSWTFREQAKFFDVVTYTGTGSQLSINHNLGSVPGCIIVKRTDTTSSYWGVYHRSLTDTYALGLNTTDVQFAAPSYFVNSASQTSTQFTVGTSANVNASGGTYVAYLFAHNAGGFGPSASDNVITCGSFTTDGSGNFSVNLGYEPQWVLAKATNEAGSDWYVWDTMRGWPARNSTSVNYVTSRYLSPNTSAAEANFSGPYVTNTGFGGVLVSSITYIYIAIRRGPMKVPTVGTSVFSPNARTGNGSTQTVSGLSFSPDLWMTKNRGNTQNNWAFDRLRGPNQPLSSNLTDDEAANTSTWFGGTPIFTPTNTGFTTIAQSQVNTSSGSYIDWLFGRAPGFFDEVSYTGNGSTQTLTHNLGAVPELIIFKSRSGVASWWTYSATLGYTQSLRVNVTDAAQTGETRFGSSTPTSTSFYVDAVSAGGTNSNSVIYVAFLFATCPGVSKVGSYTGTATTKQVDCGFTAGARFVLIKRTDSTGDWYVYDSARGIVSGNDPYLLLNSTAAEVTGTDYVDTYNAGFELSSTAPAGLNANGGTYIFLAIA